MLKIIIFFFQLLLWPFTKKQKDLLCKYALLYKNYESLGIKNIKIPAKSPNCNAYAERFVGSIRREALDFFIIFNQRQLFNIVKNYIKYFNIYRPHQGIEQNIPSGYSNQTMGKIKKQSILFGLHHHYYRKAA